MRNPLVSLLRRGSMRVFPRIGGRLLRVDPDAIRRPLRHAFIRLEGPDPSVWEGPIFIHVPKAAGSSILYCGVKWTDGHQPYSFYVRHKPRYVPMPFTFAIVRHPLSRYISAFYYLKKGGKNAQDRFWANRHIPPDADHNSFSLLLQSDPKVGRQMHLRPQIDMLVDGEGRIGPDQLLCFELLAEEWPAFAKQHGLQRELPHANKTGVARSSLDTTRECREIIQSFYREDFERLGYELDT